MGFTCKVGAFGARADATTSSFHTPTHLYSQTHLFLKLTRHTLNVDRRRYATIPSGQQLRIYSTTL
jgi:hypothetical protein